MHANRILLTLTLGIVCATPLRGSMFQAFEELKAGRSYRDNLRFQSRDTLVDKFIGSIDYSAKPPLLRSAIDEAMAIRNNSGTSGEDSGYAWYIANEGLEAMLYGYLSAGNRDLLKGTRLTFPNSLGYTEGRGQPVGAFTNYWDDPVQSLYYAELYFFEGIKEALAYMQEDATGKIRAVDLIALDDLPYYTLWNKPDYLPHPIFEDTAFNDPEDQASLTAAALLGKNVRRYGGTVVTIADKLWRAAYFHPNVQNNRQALLDETAVHLRCHIHAQYLASLPLAATLNDGQASEPDAMGQVTLTRNEYQEVGADIVRTNITGAQDLAGRISRGERPKQLDLAPRWDRAAVNSRLAKLASLYATTESAWQDAESKIKQNDAAMVSQAQDRLLRRDRYKFRLWQITGVHPDSDAQFANLSTEEGRQAYQAHVRTLVETKMYDYDAADTWFTKALTGYNDPVGVNTPTGTAELGLATLKFMLAINEVKVAQKRIDQIADKVKIEQDRNGEVNSLITYQGLELTALDVAIALASSIETTTTMTVPPLVQTTIKPGPLVEAAIAAARCFIHTYTEVAINNQNSEAVVKNLLLEEIILQEQFPSIVIQAQLAAAELKRLIAEVDQLVEDHEYHEDSTGSLWYNDPELVFEKEAAEKRYEDLVRTYQAELYVLANMLEKAWVEPYENPVRTGSGSYEQFAGDPRYDPFPDAEAIFAVGNHIQSKDFLDALRDWNGYLIGHRGDLTGGRSSNIGNAISISLRQHILGLNDLIYAGAPGSQLFQVDPVQRNGNIRTFRAHMLDLQEQAEEKGLEMRLGFPINLQQLIEVPGASEPLYLFGSAGVANPNIWNRRLLGVAVEVVGHTVTQGLPTKPNRFPLSLYLHGTVSRESRFLDSIYTGNNRTIRTDLALYQHDPLDLTLTGSDAIYAIEDLEATANGLHPNPEFAQQMPLIEWPFACDNVVLVVRRSNAAFNWENIDDFIIYLFWEAGPPVTDTANYAWPN